MAAQLFFEKGFERGTTREIARQIGVTQPALYYYVGSKEDLLSEMTLEVDRAFGAAIGEIVETVEDPVERLRSLIHAFVTTMRDHQMGFGLRFSQVRSLPKSIAKQVDADERAFVDMVQGVVADAQAAGVLPADRNTRTVTLGLLGMLSWMFWWFRDDRDDTTEIADTFCELLGLPQPRKAAKRPKK